MIAAIQEPILDLIDDDEFWRFQANSLAVLSTPERVLTFRLANRLTAQVEVSDRFHLKPLLRALTFPHTAFVLAATGYLSKTLLHRGNFDLYREVVRLPVVAKSVSEPRAIQSPNEE